MAITPTPRFGMKQFSSGADPHPTRLEHNAMIGSIESNAALYSQGPLTSRPTAGKVGRYHWGTDTKRLYADDGAAWHEVSPIGGGGDGKAVTIGGAGTEGTAERAARADHTHDIPLVSVSANGAMLAADKAKLDAATASAVGNALAMRNAAGAISVSTPTASAHAATKAYVDGRIQEAADYADDAVYYIPFASQTEYGHMTAADKKKLDSATASATGGALVSRNAAGQIAVADPIHPTHSATMSYVDAQVATRAASDHTHTLGDVPMIPLSSSDDLNNVVTANLYHQSGNAAATATLNYPVSFAGMLEVYVSGGFIYQRYTAYGAALSRTFLRGRYNNAWSVWVELADTGKATAAADGLMSAADKKKLDGASRDVVNGALVMRDGVGRFLVPNPGGGATDVVNKGYVDGEISRRGAKHYHALAWKETAGVAQMDLCSVTIPDPGYPYHIMMHGQVEASGGGTGTRWDLHSYADGVNIANARGDVQAPWYVFAGQTRNPLTGSTIVKLTAKRISGTTVFGMSSYNKWFEIMVLPAGDFE